MFDEIMRKYINVYSIKHEQYEVFCLLKLIITTSCVRHIRFIKKLKLDHHYIFSKISILSRINQDRLYFSQLKEMRITFSSSITDLMAYDYYLKEPK